MLWHAFSRLSGVNMHQQAKGFKTHAVPHLGIFRLNRWEGIQSLWYVAFCALPSLKHQRLHIKNRCNVHCIAKTRF
jgi:hypothetical protein